MRARFTWVNWFRLGIASAALVVITLLVAGTAVTQISPAISHDFPDPAVLQARGQYYAYSTASYYGGRFWHVPVQRSGELDGGWRAVADAMPTAPAWAPPRPGGVVNVTAPEVTERPGGGYLLYFVAMAEGWQAQCIGVAQASTPIGPFVATASPLVCQPGQVDSIDPQAFTDRDGSRYLLYASGRARTVIWLQRMTGDGTGLVGPPRALIQADRPDEANIAEAPSMVIHGDKYVLFYSGNAYNSGSYFVNYAVADSLSKPFVKHVGQFLNRDSLGGQFPDPGGEAALVGTERDHMVFHASTGPGTRAMFVTGLDWDAAGQPVIDLNGGLTHRYAALLR